jgi:hypothetical protein
MFHEPATLLVENFPLTNRLMKQAKKLRQQEFEQGSSKVAAQQSQAIK